ncbi:Uncharacterised protein [Porphyromonas cangingivalis]|uniref:hypothetical protein n=1 Tax=Porphyromonas cangingivalis TaxID=36874 RepID=UPI000D8B7DE7|nr:hypothetical protein [Porphyromonas cangingivalis]SPY35873.1 Uncharacterised protein [Porphyromonas cangingivalis]
MENVTGKCPTCGKKAHNFEMEEALYCVPPRDILKFGQYQIDKEYREAVYEEFPFYTTEEVVGSYLGYNPHFPSQNAWFEQKEENTDEEENE